MIEFLAKPSNKQLQTELSNMSALSLLDAQMVQLTLAHYQRADGNAQESIVLLKKVVATGPVYSIPRSWAIALFDLG